MYKSSLIKFIGVFSILLNLIPGARAEEIATVMGQPSTQAQFVRDLAKKRFDLGGANESDTTTWAYSILARKGVHSAVSVAVLNDEQTEIKSLKNGLILASLFAPVVFTHIGPIEEYVCKEITSVPDTAFVIVAGNQGSYLDPADQPSCLSKNILRVSAFNQFTGDLASFTNWGDPLVRIAAPSMEILARNKDEQEIKISNTTAGASLVAARLAIYARNNSKLKGANLIESFLRDSTVPVPRLQGKVEGSRFLHDF